MFEFGLWTVFETLAVVLCWAWATVLFRVGAPGSVSRMLALLLLIEGGALLSSGIYFDLLAFFVPGAIVSWADESIWITINVFIHYAGDCLLLALYPAFLAVALQTKLTRPFAAKGIRLSIWVVAVAVFLVIQFRPEFGMSLISALLSLMFMFATIASIHAWHVSPPGIARTRSGVFAIAFGIRDIGWGLAYAVQVYELAIGSYETGDVIPYIERIYRLSTLVYVPILAYGILRTQLFDIDLKIRWTIKQSTVAGIFVAVMFVISEGANQFLEAELGNVAGLLAAGVVMAFLAPLQRFADRVASAAMPNTENTPEYAAFRKMQVYEAAVAEALQESGISDRERSLLIRLRDSLGVTEADAEAIELELATRQTSIA
jgi:hypothetical protein